MATTLRRALSGLRRCSGHLMGGGGDNMQQDILDAFAEASALAVSLAERHGIEATAMALLLVALATAASMETPDGCQR